jgi:pyruvate dehydrogenase E1 component
VLLERSRHERRRDLALNRGGHDQQKVYAAYARRSHTGQPTVILAKTIKGYGMGVSGEGQMITHQAKKMTEDALLAFRDRFELPLTDEQVRATEFYKPPDDSPEMQYLRERRAALGGSLPARRRDAEPLRCPPLSSSSPARRHRRARDLDHDGVRPDPAALLRDKAIGRGRADRADESRTFGMEGMFRQIGIYSPAASSTSPRTPSS